MIFLVAAFVLAAPPETVILHTDFYLWEDIDCDDLYGSSTLEIFSVELLVSKPGEWPRCWKHIGVFRRRYCEWTWYNPPPDMEYDWYDPFEREWVWYGQDDKICNSIDAAVRRIVELHRQRPVGDIHITRSP